MAVIVDHTGVGPPPTPPSPHDGTELEAQRRAELIADARRLGEPAVGPVTRGFGG